MPIHSLKRRVYHHPRELIADLGTIWLRRKSMLPLMRGEVINPAFRERLMLAVTAVNECRYCSYAHARWALAKGISPQETRALGAGLYDQSPAEEIPALLYAQHWAEANGKPEAALREKIMLRYGEPTAQAMELALHLIRVGNLCGNTFDYLLYLASAGRWRGCNFR